MNTFTVKTYNNFIDVFTGEGWENHTRFQQQNKMLKFVSGKTLNTKDFKKLKQELKSNVPPCV